ncbi:MAG TPA: SDR family NAD(P)-dependent oxidoreductase [Streptosporangiaceae bacterium]|jgi:UDP-glucose 4-epimerase
MRSEPRSRVLVTGGAGFIGRRLARSLASEGHEVTVLDLLPCRDGTVTPVIGDIRSKADVARAVQPGVDVIFHLAALTSVVETIKDPEGTYATNVAGTFNLLEAARAAGVKSFLLASTNAVVGNVGGAVITERAPMRPLSPYGATKAAGEMLLSAYAGVYGIAAASMRFSNVYGPGMEAKDSFIPRLMRAARDGKGVQVRGDGTMVRDVVHVDDIVAGVTAAWRAGHAGPVILGSGQSVSVNELVETARIVTGAPIPVEYVPVGPGEMPAVKVDTSVARGLGYKPAYDLKSGLATVWPEFSGSQEADQ